MRPGGHPARGPPGRDRDAGRDAAPFGADRRGHVRWRAARPDRGGGRAASRGGRPPCPSRGPGADRAARRCPGPHRRAPIAQPRALARGAVPGPVRARWRRTGPDRSRADRLGHDRSADRAAATRARFRGPLPGIRPRPSGGAPRRSVGCPVGPRFRVLHLRPDARLHLQLQDPGGTRPAGAGVRVERGHERAPRLGARRQHGGRLRLLAFRRHLERARLDLGSAYGHPPRARRGGSRALRSAPGRPDHTPPRRGPGARGPGRRAAGLVRADRCRGDSHRPVPVGRIQSRPVPVLLRHARGGSGHVPRHRRPGQPARPHPPARRGHGRGRLRPGVCPAHGGRHQPGPALAAVAEPARLDRGNPSPDPSGPAGPAPGPRPADRGHRGDAAPGRHPRHRGGLAARTRRRHDRIWPCSAAPRAWPCA